MRRQMTDEEYEREKAEIEICLEILMELLQRKEEYQRCGFLMKRNLKWHKLQRRGEEPINAQCKEEILKSMECLREFLKTEASSETKSSECFKYDMLCVFTGAMNEKRQFYNVVIKDEGRG